MKPELWAVELGQGMGVIRLGDERQEVVRKLREAGIEVVDEEKERWFYVGEMDTELKFKTTSPQALLEIAVEDERLRLGPLPVIGERLHKVVGLLKVPDAETVWRSLDDDEAPTDGNRPLVTDEILLDGGTLWIPSLGLGLGMVRGEICTVCLRQPGESPRRGLGTLTASQRGLSARKDLPTYLVQPRGRVSPTASWFQTLLTFALFGAIGLLVWQAIDYQRRWNEAPVVPGDVLDVQPPPPDPFPTEYTIAYRDQAGTAHQVVLKRADVYLAPKVGDTVEIRFLPGSPDQPLGPARYRDIAVEKFVPLGIALFAVYLVILIMVPIAQWLLRGNRRAAS